MKFVGWYVKIALLSAMVGGSMELFMIKTGFCVKVDFLQVIYEEIMKISENIMTNTSELFLGFFVEFKDDKVTVLESEKRAWENSAEAQATREALNPWSHRDAETRKTS